MINRRLLAGGIGVWTVAIAFSGGIGGRAARAGDKDPRLFAFDNQSGQMRTLVSSGSIDSGNAFFEDLGSNGRRCVSCHQPDSAWTITPENVRERFRATHGTDPIFRNNDGSTCEGALPRSAAEAEAAYGMLLSRGLIRVGLDLPSNAEFIIDSVRDPNHCGAASNDVSAYRRPLPSANLRFLSAVMWDGRESSSATTIDQDLLHQANDATRGHAAAGRDLSAAEAREIVDFEMGLFAAQARDRRAGSLDAAGGAGGPVALAGQPFFLGINDPVGLNPSGARFDPRAITIFTAFGALRKSNDPTSEARRAIARGQEVFNTKPITISKVSGLNDATFSNGVTVPEPFLGTCTTCHDSPNAGSHSVKAPLDLGLTDPAVAPYLPVYTLRNLRTGDTIDTTDPGRALISGKWSDVGRFKGPVLRALAARPPYFHNGSAATLDEVVDFYERRFKIGLTAQERADLLAFLRAL